MEQTKPKTRAKSKEISRTSAKAKAVELAALLRPEQPDYAYLKRLFYHLRQELELSVPRPTKKLPYVPSEEEIKRYYETVWQAGHFEDIILIKTLFYTGVRVSELVNIKLAEVNLEQCQIKIIQGKGGRDRVVPFPPAFKEALAGHLRLMRQKKASYLFESSRKTRYSERGVRRMLERYSDKAGLSHRISPHQLRHFLLTWLKKQGVDDALIQPYSGHASRQSLEIYSRLAIKEAQGEYDQVMGKFPI
jgi:integrase/recombinase XerD